MTDKYRLLGVIALRGDDTPKIKGVQLYLKLIVKERGWFSDPLLAIPTPARFDERTVIFARVDPNSTTDARETIDLHPHYERVKEKTLIDLHSQVVCQDIGGIYIADAERLHHYRITLKEELRRGIRNHFKKPEEW